MIAGGLAGWVRFFTGVQSHWRGCGPEDKLRVYFANHTSHLDFLLLWAALPPHLRRRTRPVAARDYWRHGKLRHWLAHEVFRAVLIERSRVTRASNPLNLLTECLAEGDSLIMFPEGGRTSVDGMRPFKSGLFHLARSFPAAELVPVYLDNLNRVLPKGEILPIPMICSVYFGEPLCLGEGEGKVEFLQRAQSAVMALAG